MSASRSLTARVAALAVIALAGAGAAYAASSQPSGTSGTYAPAVGFNHAVGATHAVGYFTPVAGDCALTLVVAEVLDDDSSMAPTPTRLEVTLPAGRNAAVKASDGNVLTFTCAADGKSIAVDRSAAGAI